VGSASSIKVVSMMAERNRRTGISVWENPFAGAENLGTRLTRAFGGSGAMGFEPLPLLGHISNEVMGRARFLANGRRPVAAGLPRALPDPQAKLEFLDPQAPPRSVVVTSPLAEEGKSTVAASVAWAASVRPQHAAGGM